MTDTLIAIGIFYVLLWLIGWMLIFREAGQAAWKAFVPVYDLLIALRVAGRPAAMLVLLLIPVVNIAVWAIVCVDVAKRFHRDTLWGLGLWLLPGIFGVIMALLDGRLLFVCEDTEGLKVFDVENPVEIQLVAHFEGFTAFDVIPLGGLLLVVGPDNVYQFDYSDPDNIILISEIPLGV